MTTPDENQDAVGQSLSTEGLGKLTFAEHKEQTANDCEQVAELLKELAAAIREGNLNAFVQFWIEGGTEEGDSKISAIRQMLIFRFMHREEHCA